MVFYLFYIFQATKLPSDTPEEALLQVLMKTV